MDNQILSRIPQRPPFLFVDKILEEEKNKIVTTLELSGEEDFFKGHFPRNPIMPGVLIQEALFQTGALLMNQKNEENTLGVVTAVSRAKFKKMVRPGDRLILKVEMTDNIANACYFKGHAYVKDTLVASLEFTCAKI